MSTVAVPATCTCGSLLPEVVLCQDHHRYFRQGKELTSVTTIIRKVWPEKPDYSKAREDVLENARERGITVDELFSRYVNGTLATIPAGTRRDAVDLFFRLKTWWDSRRSPHKVQAQVIFADNEIAGTCDLHTVSFSDDGDSHAIYDVKTTYSLEPTYPLQLGLYALLLEAEYGGPPDDLGIIHLTARFPEPKLIKLNVADCMYDARLLRDYWLMTQRRLQK